MHIVFKSWCSSDLILLQDCTQSDAGSWLKRTILGCCTYGSMDTSGVSFLKNGCFPNSKNSCIINVHIGVHRLARCFHLLLFRGTFALQPSSGKHPGMQFDQTPSSTCRFLGPSMYLGKLLLFQTWSKGIWVGIPLLFATFWGDLRWGCATWTPWDSVVSPVWMFVGQVFPHLKNGLLEKKSKKIPRTKK